MNIRSFSTWLTLAVALIFPPPANTEPAPGSTSPQIVKSAVPPANKLDTVHIHKTYLDGDFDLAVEYIEDAMKYGGPFSHQDSIFMFKHLGVMLAAKYETREKGKRYMLALLEVEPTAKILDMYASDMIYMIFKNIKDEFDAQNPHLIQLSVRDSTNHAQYSRPRRNFGYAWIGWTAGTAALIGGAVLTFHMLKGADPAKVQENTSIE